MPTDSEEQSGKGLSDEKSPEAVGAPLAEEGVAADLADLFKVMADPTRLHIIAILAEEERCVSDIAALLEMSVSAVSHQLNVLRRTRLVRWRRLGREVHYTLDDEHVQALFRAGLDHVLHR